MKRAAPRRTKIQRRKRAAARRKPAAPRKAAALGKAGAPRKAVARRKAAAPHRPNAPAAALIQVKRVYDAPAPNDGMRILIDRLWPRGLSKDKAKVDLWIKDMAPSHPLRRWYGHTPERFEEFRRRYLAELKTLREPLDELRAGVRGRRVTLLTATRELDLSHAIVLREVLAGLK